MTVEWPPPSSTRGQAWQLGDTQRLIRTGSTDGTGACTVTFPQIDAGRRLEVTRAVIACAGAGTSPTCQFYVLPGGQAPSDQSLVSGTGAGFFDEADYPGDGLWILEGEQLLAVWAGAPANQATSVNLQARVMVLAG